MTETHGPWGKPTPPVKPPPRLRLGVVLWLGVLAALGVLILGLSLLVPGQTPGAQDGFQIVRLVGLAALVSSGLLTVRRIDVRGGVRNALTWGLILIVLVLGYAYRQDAVDAGQRLRAALFPAFAAQTAPRSIQIGQSEGGGYYVMGQVNGAPVRFAIDTGASDVVLSPADAARAHVAPGGPDQPSETANGVGYGAKTTVSSLAVGPIRLSNVTVFVNRAPMNISLLGMSFLSRLESFQVRGDRMILTAKDCASPSGCKP
jgi:aspartyl protease family protein